MLAFNAEDLHNYPAAVKLFFPLLFHRISEEKLHILMGIMFSLLYLYRNMARLKKELHSASWIIIAIVPLI